MFLPFFPAERLRRIARDLPPERPLALTARIGSQRLVVALDLCARRQGVYPGMPASRAQAMLPGLLLKESMPQAEARALERLAFWCARYSPLVAAEPPDGLVLDISGCAHLFGGEEKLLADLLARLARMGLTARAALAGSLGAAHALARYGESRAALVPADVPLAERLAPLPVAALRLAEERGEALRRLGFETIGDLLEAPRAPLSRRFGREVLERLDQALGRAAEPFVPLAHSERIETKLSFLEPVAAAEALSGAVERLCEELCGLLAARQEGARRLDLLLARLDRSTAFLSVRLARPSRKPAHMARLLIERLGELDCGLGVENARLLASATAPLRPDQIASSLAGRQEEPDLSELVDRLSSRLGGAHIFRTAPVESDFPERAVRRVPAMARARAMARAGTRPKEWPRPARLLAHPEPVEVTALLPDYPPAFFIWKGRRHRVRRADGPERIFGEWWREASEIALVRDYFQVEDEAGARFWLFRQAGSGGLARWYLHGFFG